MIRLYQMIFRSLNPPAPQMQSNSLPTTTDALASVTILSFRNRCRSYSKPVYRKNVGAEKLIVHSVYNEPRYGSAPFHFELRGVTNFDERRIGTINAMLRVCPHTGLALLGVLLKAKVIGAEIPREFSDRQRKRIAQRDRTEFMFALNVTAVEPEARTRLFNTLMAFLQFDDDRIALEAMFIEFPEFENIEVISRHQF